MPAIGARLFTLELGEVAQAICGRTGYTDVQLARQVLNESDEHSFLDNWLGNMECHRS